MCVLLVVCLRVCGNLWLFVFFLVCVCVCLRVCDSLCLVAFLFERLCVCVSSFFV